jgi:hypothetical protein
MSLSDCGKCWETPCRCPDGEIGQLKTRIKALEAAANEVCEWFGLGDFGCVDDLAALIGYTEQDS